MQIVLDTNVLVSAIWHKDSKPGLIVTGMISGRFTPCYDYRIIDEYKKVLRRPKFGFTDWQIKYLMDSIVRDGFSVVPNPIIDVPFTDESDRKFFEVAKFCGAPLITGNIKHYPPDSCVTTVADFCAKYF